MRYFQFEDFFIEVKRVQRPFPSAATSAVARSYYNESFTFHRADLRGLTASLTISSFATLY